MEHLLERLKGAYMAMAGLLLLAPAFAQPSIFQNPDPQQMFPMPGTAGDIQEQETAKFNREVLERPGIVLVEFMLPTCLICNPAARCLNELTAKYHGKVHWVRLDINKNINLSYKYDVPNVPAVLVFKDGRLIKKFAVFKPAQKDQLAETLNKLQM